MKPQFPKGHPTSLGSVAKKFVLNLI